MRNSTISDLIINAMRSLHNAGHRSVTRTLLWSALKNAETKDGVLKRASLSSCITSLIASKRLILVPVAFDVQHFSLPKEKPRDDDCEINEAAEILVSLRYVRG